MINIRIDRIPKDKDYFRYCDTGSGITTVEIKPYVQQKVISEEVELRAKEDHAPLLKRITDSFERELDWLIIKNLAETSARILKRFLVEHFNTNLLASLLLGNFTKTNATIRVICSRASYPILQQAISEDTSICGSFFVNNTFMGIPVSIENIPEDEIWVIDLDSWRLPMTEPENTIDFNPRFRHYVYKRKFKMAPPICVGDKLVRIKLIVESKEEREMRELMDRMRLPIRKLKKETTLIGYLVPTGESVWLTENPEDGLCITNIPPKEDTRHKIMPQMFNPGAVTDYQIKKKKK